MEERKIKKYMNYVKQNPENIKKIPKEVLLEYPQIYVEMLEKYPNSIKYVPLDIRIENPELCVKSVQHNLKNIKYMPEEIQVQHIDLCMQAVKNIEGILYYISIDVLEQHPEICLEALLKDKKCLEDIPEEIIEENISLQKMQEIIENWENIKDVPYQIQRQFPQLCMRAAKDSKKKYMPDKEVLVDNIELIERLKLEAEYSNDKIYELVVATDNIEYINDFIKRTPKEELINIFARKKDVDFIRELIKEKEKYGFDSTNIRELVVNLGDKQLIKELLEEKEAYSFNLADIMSLVIHTEDQDIICEYFNKRKEYGFSQRDLEILCYNIDDIQLVLGYINEVQFKETEKINLPEGMTIGIEIESGGKKSKQILNAENFFDGWIQKVEKSVNNGVEVISPVLKSEENNENDIYKICSFLINTGQYISDECGGHIHIGADYLKNIDAWKNLVEIWANTENILYFISNEEGIEPRTDVFEFASPISPSIEECLKSGEIQLDTEEDITEFCRKMLIIQEKTTNEIRYTGINFENFGDKHKNTIEFRISNGTLNPKTWIENINLFGGIIAVAQELSEIQQRMEKDEDIDEEEIRKVKAFEKIRELPTNEYNEEEKLDALLDLVIKPDKQAVYRKRYNTNKNIRRGDIVRKIDKPIIINKKKIGKLAFTGTEQTTGEEYEAASIEIDKDIEELFQKIFDID